MVGSNFNVLSLFDGIACARLALYDLNSECSYFSSEVDEQASSVAKANFPEIVQLGDVRNIDVKNLPKIDLLVGGSPCQDLSVLKQNGKGLQGEKSKLFFEYVRILKEASPSFFLLENVKNKWGDEMDRIVGYKHIEINSSLFVPQNRPRWYWTNIRISGKHWPNMAESEKRWKIEGRKFVQYRRTYWRLNQSGTCPCLTANMGTGGHNVPFEVLDECINDVEPKPAIKKDKRLVIPKCYRKLSPEDCESLQGIPKGYTGKTGASASQRYKMLGNCFTVPVISSILKPIVGLYSGRRPTEDEIRVHMTEGKKNDKFKCEPLF